MPQVWSSTFGSYSQSVVVFVLFFLLIACIAVWMALLVRRIVLERKTPVLTAVQKDQLLDPPLVSVIVPARNEEKNIRGCVESILKQDYPNYEIVVVDDESTDGTYEILKSIQHPRLRVVKSGCKPEGWAGKAWAAHRGWQESRGSWLLFTDADTIHREDTLFNVVGIARSRDLEMVSLVPQIGLEGFWAKVSQPVLTGVIMHLFPPALVNDPRSRTAYVFGSYFIVKTAVYEELRGFAAETVRSAVVEDRALGELAKRSGHSLLMVRGEGFISSRWTSGLSNVWNTLERIISSSVARRPGAGVLFAIGSFVALILPFLLLVYALGNILSAWISPFTITLAILSLVASGLIWLGHAVEISSLRISPVYAFLAPLGSCLFIGALLSTAWKAWKRKQLTWRDRRYVIGEKLG